jgi:acetate kinase
MIPIEGGQSISRGELLLNKEAGFKGLTGTAYFAEIVKRAHSESGDASAKLCYDLFVDRIGSTISSYLSELISDAGIEGVDGIIFAGWIGERCKELRQNVVRRLNWIERLAGRDNEEIGGIDERKNSSVDEGVIQEITKSDISVLTAFVVFTNEEEEMIRLAAGKLELC